MRPAAASLILFSLGTLASAHRLDEYLQATTISLEKDRVEAQIRLTPGVAVFPFIMATIDTDGDGVISTSEQRAYAERVLGDLSLAVDGDRLRLQLISTKFPTTDEMKEGRGSIQIDFAGAVRRDSPERTLSFENHHQKRIAAYLVNCLVPQDPALRVTEQTRNYEQSLYQLTYFHSGVRSGLLSLAWWSDGRAWFGSVAILLLARLAVLWRQRRLFKTALR
jgi:hypothetical protein